MKLVDSIVLQADGHQRTIQLLQGDLTAIPSQHACDVLVVSAFRNGYRPTPGTLIGALHARGVSVAELARNKEVDLLPTSSCWLSRPLQRPDLNTGRLLCFEPSVASAAAERVGDVFRSLFPFVLGEPWVRRVAMPLLASGNQGQPADEMLHAILEAATHWLTAGLALDCLSIVIRADQDQDYVDQLAGVFREAREHVAPAGSDAKPEADLHASSTYDLFISYSHEDAAIVEVLQAELHRLAPDLRVFVDRLELDPGSSWQQRIYSAIDSADRVLCLYTPDYMRSRPCQDELHIALLRNQDRDGTLIPAYLRSAPLPTYMRAIQYIDVREGDLGKLAELAAAIVAGRPQQRTDSALDRPTGARVAARSASENRPAGTRYSVDLTGLESALVSEEYELRIETTIRLQRRKS